MKLSTQNSLNQKFFDQIHQDYDQKLFMFLPSLISFQRLSRPYIGGSVLDIGNGGVISFDLTKAKKVFIADISLSMMKSLKRIVRGKILPFDKKLVTCVQADVRDLPFRNKFETVLLITTAHHLAEQSKFITHLNIQQAFTQIHQALKANGYFLLVECQLCTPAKVFQDIFFEMLYHFLIKFNRPLPYFLSAEEIKIHLEHSGFTLIKVANVAASDKVFLPLFPVITLPGRWWNKISTTHLFVARKKL